MGKKKKKPTKAHESVSVKQLLVDALIDLIIGTLADPNRFDHLTGCRREGVANRLHTYSIYDYCPNVKRYDNYTHSTRHFPDLCRNR